MKIRPKNFECALELVKQGYKLHKDGKDYVATRISKISIVWHFDEWLEDGYCWDSDEARYPNTQHWQGLEDWYFKK